MDIYEINTLLEKKQPLVINETKPSIWQKIGVQKRQHQIELKPFSYGVFLQIVSCLLEVELYEKTSIKEMAKFVSENEGHVTKMIAYAINQKPENEPPEKLIKFIKRNVSSYGIIEIVIFIIKQADLGNFTSATALIAQRLVAKNSKAGQSSSE